jgi:Mrp family chromosome partitioning ATPase
VKGVELQPLAMASLGLPAGRHAARRSVIMVTSPGSEATRAVVAINLATVCAEIGQRVVVASTFGIEGPRDVAEGAEGSEGVEGLEGAGPSTHVERVPRLSGPVRPSDVHDMLEETSVPGVSFLALQHFVNHPTQAVIRVPEVLDALRDVVDVVILEVPAFLTVHHGEGLAPLADVVLVVGERRTTTLDQVRRTSAELKRLGAPVVGMALTSVPARADAQLPAEPSHSEEQLDGEPEEDGAMGEVGLPFAEATSVTGATLDDSEDTVADPAPAGLQARSWPPADTDAPARPEA